MIENIISGIYKLIDPRTNKIRYVGLSKNVYYRKKQHLSKNNTQTKGPHLLNWLNQLYSLNLSPIFEIIEKCSIYELQEKERYWIKYYKNEGCDLVNISDGGENFNCSMSTRQKISETLKGHEVLPQTREKLRQSALKQHKENPYIYTEEQKKRLSEIRKGMKFSEEHKKNIGIAQKGKKRLNKSGRLIIDEFGNEFISISKAALFHSLKIYTIWRALNNQKTTTNIKFYYKDKLNASTNAS